VWTIANGKNKERVQVERHTGGRWRSYTLSDGTKSGDAVFEELSARHGKASIVMAHSDDTIYTLTTHQ
jgi:hypothetical protein